MGLVIKELYKAKSQFSQVLDMANKPNLKHCTLLAVTIFLFSNYKEYIATNTNTN